MAAVTFLVVAILSQCLSSIQAASLVAKDVDGGWSDFRPSGGCRMKHSTDGNNTLWTGWPKETWPPGVDSSVDICFYTWQQTMMRTCTKPRRHGKGKRCEGPWKKEAPCTCPYNVDPAKDCAVAATDKDSIQAYVSDPCRCSCFFHCHKVDNEWTVPPEPQCCPPCTFWSSVNRACIRVLDGCDEVKPKEDNKTKTETEKQKNNGCTLRKDDDDKHMFWNGPQLMSCPPNTVFSLSDCGCLLEFDPQLIRDVTCVSFDKGYNGLAATHGVWVRAQKVKVVDGGVKGKCGYFNGSSSLSMPYFSGSYGRYEQFAISFFFKREAGSTGSVGILSNGDCATKDYSSIVVTSPNSGTLRAGLKNKSGTITEQIVGEMTGDDWHYMVISWDGEKVKIFVDAKEQFVGDLEGRLDVPNCPLTVGFTRGLFGFEYFKGYMDEICFYKTSLREDEIKDMHAKPGKVYYSYYMPADVEKEKE